MRHLIQHTVPVVFLAASCTSHHADSSECTARQAQRCDDSTLVRCNDDGTGEVEEMCPLGCSATEPRCIELIPSNGLAKFVELAGNHADLNLGLSAKINTDTGEVLVAGALVGVDTDVVTQPGAPTIRVLMVRSLTANAVVVTGTNALAIVSGGEIKLDGIFSVSAHGVTAGPGAFYEESCTGKLPPPENVGGAGGGGFGSEGGQGGSRGREKGMPGAGGKKSGTDFLAPLRGGCDGGWNYGNRGPGGGGGAIQLVSRTVISVNGILAANGGGGFGGGGAGGGILLEAPAVRIAGKVVANGGGGGGCEQGADGRTDVGGTGGTGCGGRVNGLFVDNGGGGNGAAWDSGAAPGASRILLNGDAGSGGGGFGRIRVNTAPGGLLTTGVFSPNPSLGKLSVPQ